LVFLYCNIRGGRGFDRRRPGDYSYRYSSASSVREGEDDWTKTACKLLCWNLSPTDFPFSNRTRALPRTFPSFPIVFQPFQELFQDCFFVQLLDEITVIVPPLNFSTDLSSASISGGS